jgi:ABC-type transport system involved in Fe-S cluster assembly fused permease/ATPase subunit
MQRIHPTTDCNLIQPPVKITLWRKQFRKNQNKGDNKYHDVATDSLINFETVKAFTNEEHEVGRYVDAVSMYQKFNVMVQASLSMLNCTQQVILQSTMCASLVLASHAITSGKTHSIGSFVAVQVYVMQLFTPLNFLGTIYNVSKSKPPLAPPLLREGSAVRRSGGRRSRLDPLLPLPILDI